MEKLLLVAAGGAVGSACRYLIGIASLRAFGPGWPVGTLAVNVVGGLAMGLLAGWLALRGTEQAEGVRLLAGVGFLGGFTTFSAFSLETALMIERRAFADAASYAAVSTLLAVGALFLGLLLARRVLA